MQSFVDCERANGNRRVISRTLSGGVLPGLIVLLLVSAFYPLAPGGAVLAATHSGTVEFDPADLDFRRAGEYDIVSLGSGRWLNRPGEPRLPIEPYRVALPEGARVVSVSISVEESVLIGGGYSIMPSPVPQPLSENLTGEQITASESVYSMSGIYPAAAGDYVGSGSMGGVPVCDIILYPLRYVPSEGRLVLSTDMVVTVEYTSEDGGYAGTVGPDACMIDGLVYASVSHVSRGKDKALDMPYATIGESQIEYIVIADSSLAAAFGPLIRWKTRKGVPAAIVTLDEINSTYSGSDLQARIRNCISEYRSDYGTTWVLLGGDTGFIPERRLYVALSDKPSIPSDLYYADLDGTWNDDGDLRWGEIPDDGVDMYADVYIGRAPVSTPAEAAVFVDKVLTYEGAYGSPGSHVRDLLFMAEILWGDLGNPSDPEYTDGGLAKDMIEASYVPGDFTVLKLYESLYNLDQTSVVDALNAGRGMVNVNCHGGVGTISLGEENLLLSSVMSLTNGPSYALMYATSCMVGAYDQACLGEAFVKCPAGGGFFIGNSRYGWGTPGSPGEGPSDHYDQSFYETVFITGLENLGKAHAYAKHEYVAESRYDSYYRYVMYGLNLFGDPETAIWTGEPKELTVEFPAVVAGGDSDFPVTVSSGGTPVFGTMVCLYKPDDIYVAGYTDALGTMTFYIEPAEPGTLLVTVTGTNCIPYLGYSIVDDGSVGISTPEGEGPFTLRMEPNPFRSEVTLVATAVPGTDIGIEIFDIRGRRVNGFDLTAAGSGMAVLTWDGADYRGRRVSPGIYIVRASSDRSTVSRKALLIK